MKKFKSGMLREEITGKGRFDLLSPFALRRMALTAEEGTVKYEDRNWERGCPFSEFVNRVLIHLNDYMQGKRDEDHLAHAMWGIQAIIHLEETMPWLNDMPQYKINQPKKQEDKTGSELAREEE